MPERVRDLEGGGIEIVTSRGQRLLPVMLAAFFVLAGVYRSLGDPAMPGLWAYPLLAALQVVPLAEAYRSRLRIDAEGIGYRGLLRERTYPWSEVERVRLDWTQGSGLVPAALQLTRDGGEGRAPVGRVLKALDRPVAVDERRRIQRALRRHAAAAAVPVTVVAPDPGRPTGTPA